MSKFKKQKTTFQPKKQEAVINQPSPEKILETLTQVTQLNQLMIQKLNNSFVDMDSEVQRMFHMFSEIQYRYMALLEVMSVDKVKLQEVADRKRLEEFDLEAARKDETEGAIKLETVESSDNIVVITSITPSEKEDKGILRSRIKISDMHQPELEQALIGKTVGSQVTATLNDTQHLITILGISKLPEKASE